jgi:hypothetical protein
MKRINKAKPGRYLARNRTMVGTAPKRGPFGRAMNGSAPRRKP